MTEEQEEILQLTADILSAVNEGDKYRSFRRVVGGHKVFIEDIVTSFYFRTDTHGTIIDLERLIHRKATGGEGHVFHTWNEEALKEILPLLKSYYILELLASL